MSSRLRHSQQYSNISNRVCWKGILAGFLSAELSIFVIELSIFGTELSIFAIELSIFGTELSIFVIELSILASSLISFLESV